MIPTIKKPERNGNGSDTSVLENSSELFLNKIRHRGEVAESLGGGEELAVLGVYHSAPEPGQTQVLHPQSKNKKQR